MTKWFSCGQFNVCIDGKEELFHHIPFHWLKDQQDPSPYFQTVTLRLEDAGTTGKCESSDGWIVQHDSDIHQTAYVFKGKELFSLQSVLFNEVIIRVGKMYPYNVRVGIQYGMMLALRQWCVGLHGVTLMCGNEIIILSAPSGTGKTTLATLLEQYCDAVVINGDFALLTPTNEGVIFEPTPFCGTSGRSLNHRFRVNRIVFLGQAKENRWSNLEGREAMMRFMSNAFVPQWDGEMQQTVQGNILKCIDTVKVNAYDFAPTQEAAEMFFVQVGGRK